MANKRMATSPKKNSGIDTPAIPATVRELSVAEPLFSALKTPKEHPIIVEKNRATNESSKVAGTVFAMISEIATPPAMEYPISPCTILVNQIQYLVKKLLFNPYASLIASSCSAVILSANSGLII